MVENIGMNNKKDVVVVWNQPCFFLIWKTFLSIWQSSILQM